MRLIITILSVLLVFATSCNTKEEPKNYIGNAVFYAAGNMDNSAFVMEAGNNNFIMETSNGSDTLNIKTFTGTLAKNCNSCTEKLSIIFRNYEIGSSANWQADSVFKVGKWYSFYKDILPPSGYKVIFKNESVGIGNVDYKWDFGGGFGNLSESPEFVFNSEGMKSIKLSANFKDANCNSKIENPIYINPSNLNGYIDFTYTNIGNNVFRCVVQNADSNTHRFIWHYLDSTNSNPKGIIFELPAFSNEGVYQVDLLAINKATNDTFKVTKNLATAANTNCSANFSYSITPVRDTLQFNKIIVDYTSASGVKYSSRNIEQFTGFLVNEITNYKDIVPGKKTIKVKVQFTCKVSDGINTIELKDVNAVFAFSY
ncbi:MAG: hypothetical protein ACOYMA_02360 [Bacteroidia bacterium]